MNHTNNTSPLLSHDQETTTTTSPSRIHRLTSSIKRRVLSTSDELFLDTTTAPTETTTLPDTVILDQQRRQRQWQPLLFLEKRIQDLWLILYLALRLYQYVWSGIRWWFKFIRLILFTILLLPGFSQMILFYFFSPRLLRSIPYGKKPRNMLDVYLPRRAWRLQGPRPVVIYVTGGAWTIGYKAWGALFGRRLSQRGVVVFCLDYRNFPQGNALDMIEDVNTGIKWVIDHCVEYGGDSSNVWLVGQSAGGHLTAVALLCQAAREYYSQYLNGCHGVVNSSVDGNGNNSDDDDNGHNNNSDDDDNGHNNNSDDDDDTTILANDDNNTNNNNNTNNTNNNNTNNNTNNTNNNNTNNNTTNTNNNININKNILSSCHQPHWNPRHLKGYVAVSGAFNLISLSEHLHRRGLYKNLLFSIMSDHNGHSHIHHLSPTYLVTTLPHKLSSYWPMSTVLLHGTADKSVPIENAREFADALSTAGISCKFTAYQGKTHTQPIVEDPMRGGRDVLMDEVLSLVVGEKCYNEQFPMLPAFLIDAATYVCPF